MRSLLLVVVLAATPLVGCIGEGGAADEDLGAASAEATPYEVPDPQDFVLIEEDHFIEMPDGVRIHARVLRPDLDAPVPVVAEFTVYNAVGDPSFIDYQTRAAAGLTLPDAFVREIVSRGYAFAYVDTRGSSGSEGCGQLRGPQDIEDAYHITEYLAGLVFTNGKVGFIGASYPGSMAHIAGIANGPGLGAVVPVVASTSFYHYHHNGGVPYDNVATNPGYTAFNLAPNANPQHPTFASRTAADVTCDYVEQNVIGATKDGTMTAWWAERNLRPLAGNVEVPVLMAQGLADWNVKPDHVGAYFNDLQVPKKIILGQWGHQFPDDADDAYGAWWEYAITFFDQHLKGVETGVMDGPPVWVQDSAGDWRAEDAWPPADTVDHALYLSRGALAPAAGAGDTASFAASPADAALWLADLVGRPVAFTQQITYESAPLEADLPYAGAPMLNVTIESRPAGHLVAILYSVAPDGTATRENYGYLNLALRDGLDQGPRDFDGPEVVTLTMYPQDDVIPAGNALRLVLTGTDGLNTIPPKFDWTVTVTEDAGSMLVLPLRS